jgi:hypothetical protein
MKKTEISHKSISILQKCFSDYRGTSVCVPDWGKESEQFNTSSDVLLMGSYFERIFQLEFWPNQDFALFCLCPKVKQILTQLFEFDPEVVGLLSRHSLFPPSKHLKKFEINSKSSFYYAGRISPQKNIEFLILTIFYLQAIFSDQITLRLIGDFDSEYHKDILGCSFKNYQEKITALIEQLPWQGEKPQIINGLNETEWLGVIPENGLFFSTSTLISEDFSVTAAQLQANGHPMLLPFWGGFSDVRGENIKHFSSSLIADSHDGFKKINHAAKKLAMLIRNQEDIFQLSVLTREDFIPLKMIDKAYLEKIFQLNIQKWGESIVLLKDNKLPIFVPTPSGQKLFKECRIIMSLEEESKIFVAKP